MKSYFDPNTKLELPAYDPRPSTVKTLASYQFVDDTGWINLQV